jgi:hypothetical protein
MMYVTKKLVLYLFLLLFIILVNTSYGHKVLDVMSINQIYPTKDWKVVDNPTYHFSSNSGFSAAAALSAKSVWTVGYTYADDSPDTRAGVSSATTGLPALIEQWNGNSWHIMNSPVIPGASYVALSSTAALASNNVWAVGGSYTTDYSVTQQLIEHWDGKNWRIIKPPVVKDVAYSNLSGLSVLAANNIWAVGGYAHPEDHGLHHALIEHWDGNSWHFVLSPAPTRLTNSVYEELQGVVAINAKDIWAVGVSLTSSYAHRSLIEHWNGQSWSIVDGHDRLASSKSQRTLNAVAARSSSDVWAVGQANDRGPTQSLIKHWNGRSWSDIPGPGSTGTKQVADGGNLLDLTVLATNDIWAVGSYGDQPRIEHWNGKVWTIVASPTLIAGTSMLSGIVHTADAHQLWAVGSTNQQGLSETRTDEC